MFFVIVAEIRNYFSQMKDHHFNIQHVFKASQVPERIYSLPDTFDEFRLIIGRHLIIYMPLRNFSLERGKREEIFLRRGFRLKEFMFLPSQNQKRNSLFLK